MARISAPAVTVTNTTTSPCNIPEGVFWGMTIYVNVTAIGAGDTWTFKAQDADSGTAVDLTTTSSGVTSTGMYALTLTSPFGSTGATPLPTQIVATRSVAGGAPTVTYTVICTGVNSAGVTVNPIVAGSHEFVVDPSGANGAYLTIAAALTAASAAATSTSPSVVRLLSGVYVQEAQLDMRNMSYVSIVGAGKDATIIRASAACLLALNQGGAGGTKDQEAFIHMGGTTNCRLENLYVDARTNDAVAYDANNELSAVYCPTAVEVHFVNCRIEGIRYGVWEDFLSDNSATGYSVEIYNCSIQALAATAGGTALWHVFSSDITGVFVVGKTPPPGSTYVCGFVNAGQATGDFNTTFWGCHIHGEVQSGSNPNTFSVGGVAFATASNNGKVFVIGCTIHAKCMQDFSGAAPGGVGAIRLTSTFPRLILVGCDILLETATGVIGGVAGTAWGNIACAGTPNGTIDLVGCNLLDTAGTTTGKGRRGTIVGNNTSGANLTVNNIGSNFANSGVGHFTAAPVINGTKYNSAFSGNVTLSSGAAIVKLVGAATNVGGAAATSFTNGNTSVTGSGTAFLTDFKTGDYIKAASHTDGTWTQIASITSNTALTLVTGGYRGATLATTQAQQAPTTAQTQFDALYQVTLTPQAAPAAGELFYVTNKHASGFTINSSSGASTLSVDYVVTR